MFARRSKAAKAVLGGGLAGAILGVGLWINGGTNLLSELVTKVGNGTLDLVKEPAYLVFFRWVFLVLGLLLILLLVLLGGPAGALAAVSIGVLVLVLVLSV